MIPNFNGSRFIPGLFGSLAAQDFQDLEVIFVDNASSDNSLEVLKHALQKNRIPAKVLTNKRNTGYCVANNLGTAMAKGTYIVFLNNDTRLHHSWLGELVRVLEENPQIGACGCKIVYERTKTLQTIGELLDKYGWVDSLTQEPPNKGFLVDASFYPSFVAVIIRKTILERHGGFDENLFITGDYDLGWKIRLVGYSHAVALNSICYHHGKYTVNMFPDLKRFYLMNKEKIYTLMKNLSFSSILRRFPITITIMLSISVLKSYKSRKPYLPMLVYSFLWNIRHVKALYVERKSTRFGHIVEDAEIEKHMEDCSFILRDRHRLLGI